MDRNGANFLRAINTMKERLGVNAVPVQLMIAVKRTSKVL